MTRMGNGAEVTLCVMTKNEEAFLDECLRSALPSCREAIVVDTGSTDGTLEIARRHTDKIFRGSLDGDFSKPRNVALDHVRTEWVLYLDADERLTPYSMDILRRRLAEVPDDVGALTVLRYNFLASCGFVSDHVVRLFRNRPQIRYRNRVAESVVDSVVESGGKVTESPFTINHMGHWRPQQVRLRKSQFYVRLLEQRLEENPDSADILCRLALTLKKVGRLEDAERASTRAIELEPDTPMVQVKRAHILRALGQHDEALKLYTIAAETLRDNASVWNMVGVMQLSVGLLDDAEQSFALAASLDERLTHAWINQGLVQQARGNYREAVELFESAAERNPGFLADCWPGRLEPDPFQHLDNDSIMRFAGLSYHLAYCHWQLTRTASPTLTR